MQRAELREAQQVGLTFSERTLTVERLAATTRTGRRQDNGVPAIRRLLCSECILCQLCPAANLCRPQDVTNVVRSEVCVGTTAQVI
jgi:hypothetical protein